MRQEINFYQRSFRQEKPIFSAVVVAQALLVITVVMVLGYAYAWQKVEGLQAEIQIIANQEGAAISRLEKLRPIINSVTGEQSLSDQLEAALRKLDEKQMVLALVNGKTLGDTRGFSRHLRSLAKQGMDGLWLTQIKLSGTGEQTRLHGRARQPELVPTYVRNLAGEPPFAQQRFQQFQISRPEDADGDIVEFSMSSERLVPTGLAAVR